MKLCHYPDLQQETSVVVELEESDLNDKTWNCCLIGYFLYGKMPFPLLSSPARKIWKDHGKISIKQIRACYFFEFQDEDTKLKVLEGGPYFFSRRYLVLKDWHRMLVPYYHLQNILLPSQPGSKYTSYLLNTGQRRGLVVLLAP